MKTKKFSLAEVLTITTGRLLNKMDKVYIILNWMTNDNLTTIALPPAADFCKPYIFKEFPELAACSSDENMTKLDDYIESCGKLDGIRGWLIELKTCYPTIKKTYAIPQFSK